ncbi:hypothetical protein NDU88_000568 [Pleurodeles waltl]|uniref:Uncharacterized protein n=1 Tax=Pleurodeles waltl TaxID=8319 RepID=A0AAV7U3X1_PLEWA|nr:hypothetical protein NDU88_000568 [Pleurodeles waltl]
MSLKPGASRPIQLGSAEKRQGACSQGMSKETIQRHVAKKLKTYTKEKRSQQHLERDVRNGQRGQGEQDQAESKRREILRETERAGERKGKRSVKSKQQQSQK